MRNESLAEAALVHVCAMTQRLLGFVHTQVWDDRSLGGGIYQECIEAL